MISLTRRAAAPARPASRDSLSGAERAGALRVSLRPSTALFIVVAGSLAIAAAALWTALAPWIGGWRAVPATLAFAAAGALSVAAWRRTQPRVIEIGPDHIRAFARDGACVASGPLVGCSQWGAALLVLSVGTARQRRVLIVAADAAPAEAFRELAVRGRCAAGH